MDDLVTRFKHYAPIIVTIVMFAILGVVCLLFIYALQHIDLLAKDPCQLCMDQMRNYMNQFVAP